MGFEEFFFFFDKKYMFWNKKVYGKSANVASSLNCTPFKQTLLTCFSQAKKIKL